MVLVPSKSFSPYIPTDTVSSQNNEGRWVDRLYLCSGPQMGVTLPLVNNSGCQGHRVEKNVAHKGIVSDLN